MKSFNTFIAEEKKATITKKESYRGRTTADVEYNVHDENGRHIRTTKTKKEAKMWKDMHELSKEEMHKKYPELVPKLNEAAYAGNIGIMELIKFKQKATPEQKKKFDDHVKNKRSKDAWDMVQKVTGVQLHKSVHEEKKSPNPDILPPAGAGQEGTDLLVKRYKRDTPGQ